MTTQAPFGRGDPPGRYAGAGRRSRCEILRACSRGRQWCSDVDGTDEFWQEFTNLVINGVASVTEVNGKIDINYDTERSNAQIGANIWEALQSDSFIEQYEISGEGKNGIAGLTETVDMFFERAQADDVIARVKGVSAIENDLLVFADRDSMFYDSYVEEVYAFDIEYNLDPGYEWAGSAEISDAIKDHL